VGSLPLWWFFYHLPSALDLPGLTVPILNAGVDLFFVISGFVMVHSTRNRQHAPRTFLIQRFTRIVPFYWAMTFLMIAALWIFVGRPSTPEQIVKSLLFIPYLDTATGYVQPILGVGWTLNLEIIFYGLFALTMALGTLWQMVAIGVVFAIAVIARIAVEPAADTVLFFYTTPILFEFLAGMVVGHLTGHLARCPLPLAVSMIAFAIVSALVMRFSLDLPRSVSQGIPAILLVAACIRLETAFRAYTPRMLARLGDASYSLYLTHTIVLLVATPAIANLDLSPWIAGGITVMACVIVAMASYRLVEIPLLNLSRTHILTQRLAMSPKRAIPFLAPNSPWQ